MTKKKKNVTAFIIMNSRRETCSGERYYTIIIIYMYTYKKIHVYAELGDIYLSNFPFRKFNFLCFSVEERYIASVKLLLASYQYGH